VAALGETATSLALPGFYVLLAQLYIRAGQWDEARFSRLPRSIRPVASLVPWDAIYSPERAITGVKTAVAALICSNRGRDRNTAKKVACGSGSCPPPLMFVLVYQSLWLMTL
jgi:hypothetical protein